MTVHPACFQETWQTFPCPSPLVVHLLISCSRLLHGYGLLAAYQIDHPTSVFPPAPEAFTSYSPLQELVI